MDATFLNIYNKLVFWTDLECVCLLAKLTKIFITSKKFITLTCLNCYPEILIKLVESETSGKGIGKHVVTPGAAWHPVTQVCAVSKGKIRQTQATVSSWGRA